ncbi:MAG: hypothetical protein K0S47_4051 [Herbinix sp.]|jgi:hypothetical protein|nr:hypothetical protein [Herbinix sp.]
MSECPFCNSNNTEGVNHNMGYISRSYEKREGNMTTKGTRSYPFHEFLCLDCGMVHKKMIKGNLDGYITDKPYLK